jgi:hypothetical protein
MKNLLSVLSVLLVSVLLFSCESESDAEVCEGLYIKVEKKEVNLESLTIYQDTVIMGNLTVEKQLELNGHNLQVLGVFTGGTAEYPLKGPGNIYHFGRDYAYSFYTSYTWRVYLLTNNETLSIEPEFDFQMEFMECPPRESNYQYDENGNGVVEYLKINY